MENLTQEKTRKLWYKEDNYNKIMEHLPRVEFNKISISISYKNSDFYRYNLPRIIEIFKKLDILNDTLYLEDDTGKRK